MLYSQYILQDNVFKLSQMAKQIKEKCEIDILKAKYYGIAYDMAMALEETYFGLGDSYYREIREELINNARVISETEDWQLFKSLIETIVARFDDHEFNNITLERFQTNVKDALRSYSAIQRYNLQAMRSIFVPTERNVNMIDPRCRDGVNLSEIKVGFHNTTAYGIETDVSVADRAKRVLNKVAKGTLQGARISNEVFDVMFIEPPIAWNFVSSVAARFEKLEKITLHNTLKFLRPNGLLMLVIPYFRMTKDMCVFIAKNFTQVQVRKLSGNDFFDKGLVCITGLKSTAKEVNEEIYRELRRLYDIDSFRDVVSTPFETKALPRDAEEVEFFRGSILDFDEMQNIVSMSGAMDAFWNAQDVEKLSENAKQPLLPFNIGQLGLVLTSGCLDGIVDEGDGHFHIIKGRVSKQSTIERNNLDRNSVEVNETISNRVEINVLLPNGEFKVLA